MNLENFKELRFEYVENISRPNWFWFFIHFRSMNTVSKHKTRAQCAEIQSDYLLFHSK